MRQVLRNIVYELKKWVIRIEEVEVFGINVSPLHICVCYLCRSIVTSKIFPFHTKRAEHTYLNWRDRPDLHIFISFDGLLPILLETHSKPPKKSSILNAQIFRWCNRWWYIASNNYQLVWWERIGPLWQESRAEGEYKSWFRMPWQVTLWLA